MRRGVIFASLIVVYAAATWWSASTSTAPATARHSGTQTAEAPGAQPAPDARRDAGREWFIRSNCLHCHSLAGYGGQMGPELLGVGERRSEEWLVKHFLEPEALSPTTLMPAFGPESTARALAVFVGSLRTTADIEPLIRTFMEGAARLRDMSAAVMRADAFSDSRTALLRVNDSGASIGLCLEEWRRGEELTLRRECFEPRETKPGWRRYLDERVRLDSRTLALLSSQTTLDGVVHQVMSDEQSVTLVSTRPGTPRAWTETRVPPRPLFDASDTLVAAVQLRDGASAGYWVFGSHGGAHPRTVTVTAAREPGVTLIRVVTAGAHPDERWIRVRAGRFVSTTLGPSPDRGTRIVAVDELARLEWVTILNAASTEGWVKASEPSLVQSWRNDPPPASARQP